MMGRTAIVDLLSAFGLFHNISIHEPGVVLQPGPHSSAPAALFSTSVQPRSLQLEFSKIESMQFDASYSSDSSASSSPADQVTDLL